MSGNIHDTNIKLLDEEIEGMMARIAEIMADGSQHDFRESSQVARSLQDQFPHLYVTSKTLFGYLLKNYGTSRFDEAFFKKTMSLMLGNVKRIQDSNVSQHKASEEVGTHLATTFIPQLRK